MRRIVLSALICVAVVLALTGRAHALNARTWISGKGADQAGCGPISSPCRSLQFAHDQTSAGGEIDVLDPAGYGSVTINKGITILNEGVGVAGVLAPSGGNAITIFAPLDANIVLKGLTIEGAGAGHNGVVFLRAKSLSILDCLVQGFVGANDGAGNGIRVAPTSGEPNIFVANTRVMNNGYVGFYFQPSGAGGSVTLDHVTATNNMYGISIVTTGATAFHRSTISQSIASGNSERGFEVINDSNIVSSVFLDQCLSTRNKVGFYARGNSGTGRTFVDLSGNRFSNNSNYDAESGGGPQFGSYQNNVIYFPASGFAASPYPLK